MKEQLLGEWKIENDTPCAEEVEQLEHRWRRKVYCMINIAHSLKEEQVLCDWKKLRSLWIGNTWCKTSESEFTIQFNFNTIVWVRIRITIQFNFNTVVWVKRGEGNAWETRSTLPHLATCNGRALLDGEPYITHTALLQWDRKTLRIWVKFLKVYIFPKYCHFFCNFDSCFRALFALVRLFQLFLQVNHMCHSRENQVFDPSPQVRYLKKNS